MIAEDIVDCDGYTREQCIKLRECLIKFDSCIEQARDTYRIEVSVCGDWSTKLTAIVCGVLGGAGGAGCFGPNPWAIGGGALVGGVVGGVWNYNSCLRDARTKGRIAIMGCINEFEACRAIALIIMPL